MEIGRRIIFDQDGEIIAIYGETEGDVIPRKGISKIDYIDIPFNSIPDNCYIEKIDTINNVPVIKRLKIELTEEEKEYKS
ncbi:Uncharacterised protein [Clostridioides difficile]|uniref:DUF3006 domain-containing protein n=1 Tax=Clostridioides difficile TaxID=1496 RepID=A0AB74QC81_CLODI|nr:hypothetical protein [Clostridioides difficile]EQG76456.1 hypothetical protein QKA_1901 [Clostridioides difficile DA00165]EAA0008896.1 hypothetical protein [Clostridioides difficile]EGT3779274.1 hypothetical protein [Clostridioides difficile]EGT3797177.1 hypothetical protein [Clostridioides difficile]EGT3816725.1 hypothetical protein [Clostridioides difficile]